MKWELHQRWRTSNRQIFVVTEVKPDGSAMLQMIYPIVTRAFKQKEIPAHWTPVRRMPRKKQELSKSEK
jgi:hypothetical protein